MSDRHHFDAGADGYDRGFGSVSAVFIPTLLRLAHVGIGQRVLDVAAGTGIATKALAEIVGPHGHVIASDISAPILNRAEARLAGAANVSFAVQNGEALGFLNGTFDAVVCSMGLMLFSSPARGLSEFYRVLSEGGYAAVSVGTTADLSFVARISAAIGRRLPARAPAAAKFFSLGDAQKLERLFREAGFSAIETTAETRRFRYPSFDAYFEPIEAGAGNVGVEYASLPAPLRRAVREDVRRDLEGAESTGGAIEVGVELLFVAGRK